MAEEIQTVKLFYVSVKGRTLNEVDEAEERVSVWEGEKKLRFSNSGRNIFIVVKSRCYLLNSCQFKIHWLGRLIVLNRLKEFTDHVHTAQFMQIW